MIIPPHDPLIIDASLSVLPRRLRLAARRRRAARLDNRCRCPIIGVADAGARKFSIYPVVVCRLALVAA